MEDILGYVFGIGLAIVAIIVIIAAIVYVISLIAAILAGLAAAGGVAVGGGTAVLNYGRSVKENLIDSNRK